MAFRSANTVFASSGTISVSAPTGVAAGDVVVCAASDDNATGTRTLPSGCTELPSSPLRSTADNMTLWCGVKAETGPPPASYTFGSAVAATVALVAAYTGIDTANPVNESSGLASSTASASPRSMDATGITTTAICDLLYVAAADWQSVGTQAYTEPASYAERVDFWDGANFPSITLADREAQAAGSTGTVTGTATNLGTNAGYGAFLMGLANVATVTWYDHEGCAPWSSVWRTGRV